jgi:hypothetical protein
MFDSFVWFLHRLTMHLMLPFPDEHKLMDL